MMRQTLTLSEWILQEWDIVRFPTLEQDQYYLYTLSVVLATVLDPQGKNYDYHLVSDLLSWKKSSPYTKEQINFFLSDLKLFTSYWAENYLKEGNAKLLDIFQQTLPTFYTNTHFDKMKPHWLQSRIHNPIIAVLSLRAKEWRESAPNEIKEELLDNLY